MGEARRRNQQGLVRDQKKSKKYKDFSPKIFDWLPTTEEQEQSFIKLTTRGAWIGIALLVCIWIVVRFIGPAAGWWIPADLK